jgi:hypothetical protein
MSACRRRSSPSSPPWSGSRRAPRPDPPGRQAARVRQAALDYFLAKDLHLTRERTGVLIFAALAEHRVEVIADEGIHAAAPKAVWDEVVADLVEGLKRGAIADGFVAAIARTGAGPGRPRPAAPRRRQRTARRPDRAAALPSQGPIESPYTLQQARALGYELIRSARSTTGLAKKTRAEGYHPPPSPGSSKAGRVL